MTSSSLSSSSKSSLLLTTTILSSILIRTLVGFHNHSGKNENHDNLAAYGGDYEAQRHWMELTLHLPMKYWYTYDTTYWGLDYPILTAYVSYIYGYLASILIGEDCMKLDLSRGNEDLALKAFMRASVLILDILVYFVVVIYFAKRLFSDFDHRKRNYGKFYWLVLFCLFQPSIILIDHGHFQYNTTALGLALWSFYFMTIPNNSTKNDIIASIVFCLSLNFKQMSLYYAPAVFCFLLGKCMQAPSFSQKFRTLGITVLITFVVLWSPYFYSTSQHIELPASASYSVTTTLSTDLLPNVKHVLHRIFPFYRGLFENKVSNIWCVLSFKPIQIRNRLHPSKLPLLATLLTLILSLPSCYMLLFFSRKKFKREFLLWAVSSTALSFFLASYQVHEKSILMVVAPLSLLFLHDELFVGYFFSIVSAWTLFPLLQVDKLYIAYFSCMIVYLSLLWLYQLSYAKGKKHYDLMQKFTYFIVIPISWLVMISLHLLELTCLKYVPNHLPDLFTVLWSISGCAFFCWSWIYCNWKVFKLYRENS